MTNSTTYTVKVYNRGRMKTLNRIFTTREDAMNFAQWLGITIFMIIPNNQFIVTSSTKMGRLAGGSFSHTSYAKTSRVCILVS